MSPVKHHFALGVPLCCAMQSLVMTRPLRRCHSSETEYSFIALLSVLQLMHGQNFNVDGNVSIENTIPLHTYT